ncbi:MAG: YcgN family cysteine cluster protein [Rhodospirillales bacterium]|nr:YcgN family cysteine cluster protein [Rhodospirillales bacterium]
MTRAEWESVCDGCAKCCLAKLEEPVSGDIVYTNVACRLLDLNTCRCRDYANRKQRVPSCQILTPETVAAFDWLPASCAYRRIVVGDGLPWWHHLVSGDPDLVHRVGASVRGRAVPEAKSGPIEHHIVTWPNEGPNEAPNRDP